MTSTSTRKRGGESSSRATARGKSRKEPTAASSGTPVSMTESKVEFASVKLTRPFSAWLKLEAARRGVFMYELVEELVARGFGGRRVWETPRS
jgi:hypothetical protein